MVILFIRRLQHFSQVDVRVPKDKKIDRQFLAAGKSHSGRKELAVQGQELQGPLWRGGGVTFAAQQQEHFKKLNKKMYQSALRSVISELARQQRLIIVKDFSIKAPKTKDLVAKLADFEMSDGLIVTTKVTDDLILASRNLRKVEVCEPFNMDLVSLIGSSKVLITVDAVKRIEEHLG